MTNMYITLTGIIIVVDIVVSAIAASIGKYDVASYYVLLGILFTILFTSSSDTDDTERNDDTND